MLNNWFVGYTQCWSVLAPWQLVRLLDNQPKLFIVCGNGLQQYHAGQQKLRFRGNEMTMKTSASKDIFSIFPHSRPSALTAKVEKVMNKQTKKKEKTLITAVIHSFRVLQDLALCLPTIMPWVLMHFDFFIRRQRLRRVRCPKGNGRFRASVVSC